MIVPQQKEKKPHIKKPLNAFMLFMKEKRAEVMKDCTLKESAAINQILGKMVSLHFTNCSCSNKTTQKSQTSYSAKPGGGAVLNYVHPIWCPSGCPCY